MWSGQLHPVFLVQLHAPIPLLFVLAKAHVPAVLPRQVVRMHRPVLDPHGVRVVVLGDFVVRAQPIRQRPVRILDLAYLIGQPQLVVLLLRLLQALAFALWGARRIVFPPVILCFMLFVQVLVGVRRQFPAKVPRLA